MAIAKRTTWIRGIVLSQAILFTLAGQSARGVMISFSETSLGSGDLEITIDAPITFTTLGSGENRYLAMVVQDLYSIAQPQNKIPSGGWSTTSSMSILSTGETSLDRFQIGIEDGFGDLDGRDFFIAWDFDLVGTGSFTVGDTVTIGAGTIVAPGQFGALGGVETGPKSAFFMRLGGTGTGPDTWEVNSVFENVTIGVPEPTTTLLYGTACLFGCLWRRRKG